MARTPLLWLLSSLASFVVAGGANGQANDLPSWAYPVNQSSVPAPASKPDDTVLLKVAGSSASYTVAQISNLYGVPDWHPEGHPPMPDIVGVGRKPAVFACGYCHLPNGLGRPENAGLAGRPAAYVEQQLADYRSGARGTALRNRIPAKLMIANSRAITEPETREAARYFAALPPQRWVRVVETETVPKTRVSAWALVPTGEGTEPLGQRIIEIPEDLERFKHRDATSGFVAYVPTDSVAKGRELVSKGPSGAPCGTCHGQDLRGMGPIPRLAGRSPTYIVRQLYEFQHGIRAGAWSGLMAPQVGQLSTMDMIDIAAYAASLEP